MLRRILVALLAAAGLVAIWSFSGTAQDIDSNPCRQACLDQQSECLSACGTESGPADCDTHCQDQYEDCVDQCD